MKQPHVLYLVSEPWYFANHRLDHARSLINAGFDVSVATRRGEREGDIDDAGVRRLEFSMQRGTSSPLSLLREVWSLRRLVRRERPDVVHAVALKPVALALALLVMWRRPALVLSVNGLGISAVDASPGLALFRRILRFAGGRRGVELLFQTRSDQESVVGADNRGTVIPGVGVDLDAFASAPAASGASIRVCYLGRAVRSKGLTDLAEAMNDERVSSRPIEIHAYCSADDESPGALTGDELDAIAAIPSITMHPPTSDPAAVLRESHAAILPSRAGEGVSKFVLEAFASATPILLSAGSGSAEVVTDGVDGMTFDAADPSSIADTLVRFADLSDSDRSAMGAAGRRTAEASYGTDTILPQIVALHRRLTRNGDR